MNCSIATASFACGAGAAQAYGEPLHSISKPKARRDLEAQVSEVLVCNSHNRPWLAFDIKDRSGFGLRSGRLALVWFAIDEGERAR